MPTKAPVKKTTKDTQQTKGLKPVKKTVKKSTKKFTWDDIEEGFKKLQKSQDEAWAAIRETQQAHKETERAIKETQEAVKETQQAVKETQKNIGGLNNGFNIERDEAWKAIRETQQAHKEAEKARDEAWKAIRETQKNIGGLNNTLGSIVEHLLTPSLPKKFKKLGYSFNRISTYKFAEGVYAQIDGMLENGEQAVAVEVKTTLRQADIDDHLVRMEKIRKYADEHGDKRLFMGAMAATITDESTRNHALNQGLFVIEPSGDDVKVTKPEGEVRVW